MFGESALEGDSGVSTIEYRICRGAVKATDCFVELRADAAKVRSGSLNSVFCPLCLEVSNRGSRQVEREACDFLKARRSNKDSDPQTVQQHVANETRSKPRQHGYLA